LDATIDVNHDARRIDRLVEELDLPELEASYTGRGSPPVSPRLLLKVALMEMRCGKQSPAQWAKDVRENDALKWLGQGILPSRALCYRFRDRLKDEWLQKWNARLVRQAVAEKHTSAEHGSLDGTTLAACASRHQLARSEKLCTRYEQLTAATTTDLVETVRTVLVPSPSAGTETTTPGSAPADPALGNDSPSKAVSAGTGACLMPVPISMWMAKTPHGRESQRVRYEQAMTAMRQRQDENAQRRKDRRQAPEKIVISVSDPEAALGLDKYKVFRPLYNIQVVRDRQTDLSLAYETFAQSSDAGTLPVMQERVHRLRGRFLNTLAVDAGYVTLNDLQFCEDVGTTLYGPYQSNSFTEAKQAGKIRLFPKEKFSWSQVEQTFICPQGHRLRREWQFKQKRHGGPDVTVVQYRCSPTHCQTCPVRERCTRRPEKGRTVKRLQGQEVLDRHQLLMQTAEAKIIRKQRPCTIERHFADTKCHRSWSRFHGRGLERARTETGLMHLAHNIVVLDKLRERRCAALENTS
jgi:transposase